MGARSNGAGGFRGFRNTSVSDILSSTDSQRMANMLTRCSRCGNTGSLSPRPPYVHAIARLLAPIQWDWREKPPCYSLSIFIPKRGGYINTLINTSLVAQTVKRLPTPGLIPGSGQSPAEGNGNPFQHSCLENPIDRGA